MLVLLMVEFEEVSFFLLPCSCEIKVIDGFCLGFFFLAHPFRAGVSHVAFLTGCLKGFDDACSDRTSHPRVLSYGVRRAIRLATCYPFSRISFS